MIITQGAFGRYYLQHPTRRQLAWAGHGYSTHCNGVPTGPWQICNFSSRQQAMAYRLQAWNLIGPSLQEATCAAEMALTDSKKGPHLGSDAPGGN